MKDIATHKLRKRRAAGKHPDVPTAPSSPGNGKGSVGVEEGSEQGVCMEEAPEIKIKLQELPLPWPFIPSGAAAKGKSRAGKEDNDLKQQRDNLEQDEERWQSHRHGEHELPCQTREEFSS